MALFDQVFGPRVANPYAPGQSVAPNAFQNNSSALMLAGLGLLGGQNPGQQWQNAASGLATGMQFDMARRDRAQQQQERAEQRNATMEYLKTTGRFSDNQLNAAQGSPQVMNALLQQSFAGPKERKMVQGADGYQYYADTGERVLPGVQATPKDTRTTLQKNYDAAVAQGFQGTIFDYEKAMAQAGASQTNVNMNTDQSKAAGFADRMMQSEQILQQTEQAGLSMMDRQAAGIPVIGNYLTSDEFKSFEQAKRDFVNAVLRRESGAVISQQEFDNADKQYFPQPGDSPQVIAQKRRNRQVAIDGIARAAGPTYQPATIGNADPLGIRG